MLDLLIIGGGVTGAGVLRDAAMRGLRCLLVERAELGSGTTSASSRLVHGGLRYLLYDRLTTHVTSWDSGHIVRIARPLLKRLPILWPVYRDHRHGLETVESLLEAYDEFQRMKLGRPHLRLTREATLALVPGLKPEGLLGSAAFDEWAVPPRELVRRNVESAVRYGARAVERTQAVSLLKEGSRVVGARLEGAQEGAVRAKTVLNAGGPWVDRVAALGGAGVPMRLRRGTHLVYRRRLLPVGLLLEAADRERYVFILPFDDETLVGPTDVPAEAGRKPKASPEETRYLLESARRYFPSFPESWDGLECGARPILGQAGDERLLSRDHQVIDHGKDGIPGFVTVAGGKLSSFRLMAEEAVDLVASGLGARTPCRTHLETLEGSPVDGAPELPLPNPGLKTFLAGHPRTRELHALAHLAAAWSGHWFRRSHPVAEAQAFWEHFGASEFPGPTAR